MSAEDLRVIALVLLGAAAVAIAGDVLLLVQGFPIIWLGLIAVCALVCITAALVLIVWARHLERRLMDRIDQ